MDRRVIYAAAQQDFMNDVDSNLFLEKMQVGARACGIPLHTSEANSWDRNADKISSLVRLSGVQDTYVTFEYLMPYCKNRIDCMIYGSDSTHSGNVVHIELKQWSNESVKPTRCEGNLEVEEDSEDNAVMAYTGGAYRRVPHPSQQVKQYSNYLSGFVEVISTREIEVHGMAYCYNYLRKGAKQETLYSPEYSALLQEYKTFSRDDVVELAETLKKVLCGGDGYSIFNKMMSSRILPSKKLLESATEMVDKGNSDYFSLLGEQIVAKNLILAKVKRLKTKKSVVIVNGGPGTGKTVIALHLLAELANKGNGFNIRYATKSKPLLEGVKHQLPRGSQAKLLFSSLSQFIPANFNENEFDVLMIDEAHRIGRSPNSQYTVASKRTDLSQVDSIVRCAKVCVFFIDDKQAIRSQDIGSTAMILESAAKYGAEVEQVELTSQFRCNGSDNYLDWLDGVLYNKPDHSTFSLDEFDFRVFDTPAELYDAILKQNAVPKQTARLTAGFCWPWSSDLGADGELVKDVRIGDFAMPWETKDSINPIPKGYVKWYEWAYKPEGIKQVGCIYTAQGFEFDYVGVIIGKDLVYNQLTGQLETDYTATKDPMLRRGREHYDEYVRNIYRVLMSRGMKGCYIYCCDAALSDYFKSIRPQEVDRIKLVTSINPGPDCSGFSC
jgi:Uncharacterized conserved protein